MDTRPEKKKSIAKTYDVAEALSRYVSTSGRWKRDWARRVTELSGDFLFDDELYRKIAPNVYVSLGASASLRGTNLCYLIKCVDVLGRLVFSKIGTTSRSIAVRMREHLRAYRKYSVVKIFVQRVYSCGTRAAEGLESYFRAVFIQNFNSNFQKNDRFFNLTFDLKQADRLAVKYLGS